MESDSMPLITARPSTNQRQIYAASLLVFLKVAVVLSLLIGGVFLLIQQNNNVGIPVIFKVLVIGDSLTEQGLYRDGFVQILMEKFNRRADIIPRGFSGYTSKQIWDSIVPITYQVYTDIAFLLIGTNDSRTSGPLAGCTVDEYKLNIKSIIAFMSKHTKTLYLVTPPPTTDTKEHNNSHTMEYRNALIDIGKQYQIKVVDTWNFINASDLIDKIHFNTNGNAKIALEYGKIIEEHHPQRFLE